jgi:peptidyl-prolyl cis-trans isomerase B (cyclophilin B)
VLAFLCSLLGIIFSAIALNQLKTRPGQRGKGLATAGLILSIAFIIIGIVVRVTR